MGLDHMSVWSNFSCQCALWTICPSTHCFRTAQFLNQNLFLAVHDLYIYICSACERPDTQTLIHSVMPEVCLNYRVRYTLGELIYPQREETTNGDYEYISYENFVPMPYCRLMYWRAAKEGSYLVTRSGEGGHPQRTNLDNSVGVELDSHCGLNVTSTEFKLIKK